MSSVATKIAVIGSGISGAVCASALAKNGMSVTLFESARGPGGRMSQRREMDKDGKELLFDHGAPFFRIENSDAFSLVHDWESRGLVSEWNEVFGSFDCASRKFVSIDQDGFGKKYVGVPVMNSICKALCQEKGIESKFSAGVGKMEWLEEETSWALTDTVGQNLGRFQGVVASDKNIASPRFMQVTGRPPPLDLNMTRGLASKLEDIPVEPRFALMVAFREPLSSIPAKGISFRNSEVLSWAYCDSSKPERSTTSERWVLHSTAEFASKIISQTGLTKPSNEMLTEVAEKMLKDFQETGFVTSPPIFMKAHRWGSAFPAKITAKEERCIWDGNKKLVICGDFCVSPNVEGAILSGLAAASKLSEIFSRL